MGNQTGLVERAVGEGGRFRVVLEDLEKALEGCEDVQVAARCRDLVPLLRDLLRPLTEAE